MLNTEIASLVLDWTIPANERKIFKYKTLAKCDNHHDEITYFQEENKTKTIIMQKS